MPYVGSITDNDPNLVSLVRGEDRTIELVVTDSTIANADQRVDLTFASVWMTVRARSDSGTPLILKRNQAAGGASSQILVLLPQDSSNLGHVQIYLVPDDTARLKPGVYVYDIWTETAGGKRYAVISRSTLRIEPNISILP